MIFDELYDKIKQFDTITIFGHTHPDGDCYGSQIGLKESIIATFPNKQVYANGSGWKLFCDVIGDMDQVPDEVISNSLALVLDVADENRVEDQRFKLAKKVFKVDHHIPNYNFGDWQWVDTNMLAVSEMITFFVEHHHLKISQKGASALALGIITDSGRFLYGDVGARTFHLFSKLLDWGAETKQIYSRLYMDEEQSLKIKAAIYNNYQTTANGVIYIVFTKSFLKEHNLSAVMATSYVNSLSNIKGYPVWVAIAEDQQRVRIELRSNGVNVQTIAYNHGGGGHYQASGATISSLEEANEIIEQLDELLVIQKT
jgi:bifunctional oligoribonuclease and PAP phosphatase NrnA